MSGWRFFWLTALLSGAAGLVPIALWGTSDASLQVALIATARISLVLFLAAFVASSARRLVPSSPATRWLAHNRRFLGLSFGFSHTVHLAVIFTRFGAHWETVAGQRSVVSMLPGFIAYVFILLMLLTSFPGPTKWLGARRWKRLHKIGIYVIFTVFALAYASRLARGNLATAAPLACLATALLVRIGAARKGRNRSVRERASG